MNQVAAKLCESGQAMHVIASSLFARFSSRGEAGFADKLLSAMRFEFGGHLELEQRTVPAPAGKTP